MPVCGFKKINPFKVHAPGGSREEAFSCSLQNTVLGTVWESDTRLQECISLFGIGVQWLFCIHLYSSLYMQCSHVCDRVLNFACVSDFYRSLYWKQ